MVIRGCVVSAEESVAAIVSARTEDDPAETILNLVRDWGAAYHIWYVTETNEDEAIERGLYAEIERRVKALAMTERQRIIEALKAYRAERMPPRHREGTPPAYRQEGEHVGLTKAIKLVMGEL